MFSEISELKSIRKQKSILSERESELSAPIMSDLDYIPSIYKWFCEIQDLGIVREIRIAFISERSLYLLFFSFMLPVSWPVGECPKDFGIRLPSR